jgi:hypothetical protein
LAQVLPTTTSPTAPAARGPLGRDGLAVALILACYLLAALAVAWHLWADPAGHTVAGNPNDADVFAWYLRYDATAVAHGRLPALVTAAMNAPQGINMMWNNSMPLPGVLLTPVTLLAGPQTALTVLTTVGFAGSAATMFLVMRRWEVSTSAAALAGAVYGFSPVLLHSSVGHYNVQLAVLPPLIIDAGLRVCVRSRAPARDGIVLGLLVAAQLFTGEESLMLTGITGLLMVAVLAAGQPRAALARWRPAASGLAVAAGVTLLLAGYPLWVQFFGPLTQSGSPFTPDFFENDLAGFVTPSRYLLFHTSSSAAAAARYQGGVPEYLAYLGWPLIAVLAVGTLAFWRRPAVRAAAVTLAVLDLLSLGGHPLVGGTLQPGVTLPWHWLETLPVLQAVLPNRLSVVADGAAAALLAFCLDLARAKLAPVGEPRGLTGAPKGPVKGDGEVAGAPEATRNHGDAGGSEDGPGVVGRGGARGTVLLGKALVAAVAVAVCLPLVPLPLPAAAAPALPAGWSAAFAALRLPPGARVLVIPVPTATLTDALRWQADTGQPASLIGGYFFGPAGNGQAYVDGNGPTATTKYLDALWSGGAAGAAPAISQVRADLTAWRPSAVVAVTSLDSPLGRYLAQFFGEPGIQAGRVLAWRL